MKARVIKRWRDQYLMSRCPQTPKWSPLCVCVRRREREKRGCFRFPFVCLCEAVRKKEGRWSERGREPMLEPGGEGRRKSIEQMIFEIWIADGKRKTIDNRDNRFFNPRIKIKIISLLLIIIHITIYINMSKQSQPSIFKTQTISAFGLKNRCPNHLRFIV